MSRVADSTIKGFLYQFNLTLKRILESTNDEEIQVEGIIEDIDVISGSKVTAIQCKYHESQEKFDLSTIYKPILQMLKNYTLNPDAQIKYILYAYFPTLEEGKYVLTKKNFEDMLATNNIDNICNYIAYIKPCKTPEIFAIIDKKSKTVDEKKKIKDYYIQNEIDVLCDIDLFISKYFSFEIGKSYSDMEVSIKELLVGEGFSKFDVQDIFYPNVIQKIAEISSNKNDKERIVNKQWIINDLKDTKTTAITRWTKELMHYKELLKTRRKQLSEHLNVNFRKRCFILESSDIDNFDKDIVVFLSDFTNIYCSKVKLHIPATFCIIDYTKEKVDDLISRLYSKNIIVENGYKGNIFFKDAFVKEPEKKINEGWIQFVLKLCHGMAEIYEIINQNKPDDIFIIGKSVPSELILKDVNVEKIEIANFTELRYLLKLESEIR